MIKKLNRLLPLILIVIASLITGTSQAQIGCFQIRSILVDACGNPEGENEMVRFDVGANPLTTSSLNVNWSTTSNLFLGICQSAATNNIVNTLNASIIGCGHILQPTGGIIPANSKVILATSTNLNPAFNSFANLQDTIYMLFQCSGNTAGHFKNYQSGAGPRNFSMSFGAGCSDAVTYIVDSLIDPSGNHTAADGATVDFNYAGNATYTNNGCQAPIDPLITSVSASATVVCPGTLINVSALITNGSYSSFFWTGGHGIFGTPSTLVSAYQTNSTYTGVDALYFGVITNCNDTVYDTLQITINNGASVVLTASGPTTFCQGDSVILTASGAAPYLWSTGATTSSITIMNSGTYTVTGTSSCGVATASQAVTVNNSATTSITAGGPTTFCSGGNVTLTASGASSYLWSTGATTATINVTIAGNYTVSGTSTCGVAIANQTIVVNPLASASITANGPTTFCPGQSVVLNAPAGYTYLWSNGSTGASITTSTANTYIVTVSNICGSSSASQVVSVNPLPQVSTTVSGPQTLCASDSAIITATGNSNFVWSTGATTSAITVHAIGSYTVSVTNSCGTSTSSQTFTSGALPIVSISGSDGVICNPGIEHLEAIGTGTFQWSTGASSANIDVISFGVYIVTATNSCGNTIDSIEITQSNPIANFIPSVSTGPAPLTVTFLNQSQNALLYNWTFGNGATSPLDTPEYTFTNEGIYNVVLTAEDSYGCIDSHSDTIYVLNTGLYIPNVFTPNNDDRNEQFNVTGTGITGVEGTIINRWGDKIASWNSVTEGWRGVNFDGDKSPEGVYYYLVKVSFSNNTSKKLYGTVTLLR